LLTGLLVRLYRLAIVLSDGDALSAVAATGTV
jgi:hypothetical protein